MNKMELLIKVAEICERNPENAAFELVDFMYEELAKKDAAMDTMQDEHLEEISELCDENWNNESAIGQLLTELEAADEHIERLKEKNEELEKDCIELFNNCVELTIDNIELKELLDETEKHYDNIFEELCVSEDENKQLKEEIKEMELMMLMCNM